MQVRVINLLSADDRRIAVSQQLKSLGTAFEIVSGVDGDDMQPDEFRFVNAVERRRRGRYPLTAREIGCCISHRNILADVVENGPEMLVILEDDVILDNAFANVILEIETKAMNFDVVFLTRTKKNRKYYPLQRLCSGYTLGRLRYNDSGTFGYAISRSGAERFLQQNPRQIDEFDRELHAYWRTGLNTCYVDPPIVYHATLFPSCIKYGPRSRGSRLRTLRDGMRVAFHSTLEAWRRHRAFEEIRRTDLQRFPTDYSNPKS